MSRTLSASDRSSLIKMASNMPAGSAERQAILAGLQMAAVLSNPPASVLQKTSGSKSPVQFVLSKPNFSWTTAEVWAHYQNRFPPNMAAEAAGNADLMNKGWDGMSENEAWAMSVEMRKLFQRQLASVVADLKAGVASGVLIQVVSRGGGGEWKAA